MSEHLVCMECDKKAKWLRVTQFAGKHPYCKEHAKMEIDFKESDQVYWVKINRKKKEDE